MKYIRALVPCLALAATLAACDDGDDLGPGNNNNTATVRFVNAMSGGTGNLAVTANGKLVGTGISFGNQQTICATVPAGSGSFQIGTLNSAGTGLETTTSTFTQSVVKGQSYTVVATGTATNPSFLFLNNAATTNATTGNANIRFVNATGTTFDVFTTAGGALGTPTATNLTGSTSTDFFVTPTTNNTIVFTNAGSQTAAFTTTPLNLSSTGSYTLVLVPSTTDVSGFQTILVNSSCQ